MAQEPDGFTQMIDAADAFFAELAVNNSKDWFNPRKEHYTAEIKKPAELFAEIMAEEISRLFSTPLKGKLFRIYRDVRFSKDKTPLNAHLHILWSQPREHPFAPAFFFESVPGAINLGVGIMGMKGETLAQFRAFVDAFGSELDQAIAATDMILSDWGPAPLKRVPAPYAKDHPQAALLKRKALILGAPLDPAWRDTSSGLISATRAAYAKAKPLAELLRREFD